MSWPIIGNRAVVDRIEAEFSRERLSHASLVHGPQGVGKMTLAVTLAMALSCTDSPKPCGACAQCKRIERKLHTDVLILGLDNGETDEDARKEIGIEAIKDLLQSAGLKPYEGTCKVFIIDGAERLSAEAANRLLKTLEEPPPNVYFVLLAVDVGSVLPTIVSRCRSYELRPLPTLLIEQALVTRFHLPAMEAHALAAASLGSIGWAFQAAEDEALMVDRDERLRQVSELSQSDYHQRLELSGRMAGQYAKRRDEVTQLLTALRQWWRDLLLVKAGRPELATNQGRLAEFEAASLHVTLDEVSGALRQILSTSRNLQQNANPRLALDVLVLNIPMLPTTDTAATSIIQTS